MFKKFGLVGFLLAATFTTMFQPAAASAQSRYDRNGSYYSQSYGGNYGYGDSRNYDRGFRDRDWRDRKAQERAWREHERWESRRDQQRYYDNRYGSSYYYQSPYYGRPY